MRNAIHEMLIDAYDAIPEPHDPPDVTYNVDAYRAFASLMSRIARFAARGDTVDVVSARVTDTSGCHGPYVRVTVIITRFDGTRERGHWWRHVFADTHVPRADRDRWNTSAGYKPA